MLLAGFIALCFNGADSTDFLFPAKVGDHHGKGHDDHDREGDVNMLSAFVHVLSGLFSAILMTVAALLIYFHVTPGVATDSICSLVVSTFVLLLVGGFSKQFRKVARFCSALSMLYSYFLPCHLESLSAS